MKGRKPKPTILHKRHGTLNVTDHRARLEGEPIPVTEIMGKEPEWMTAGQKDAWRYALDNAPPGVLKAIDADVLATWVCAVDRHRRSEMKQAELDKDSTAPMLARTKDGNVIQSPYIGISNRAAALMIKLAGELGFSPAARPRLAVATGMVMDAPTLGAPAPPSDNFDAFLARRPEALDS